MTRYYERRHNRKAFFTGHIAGSLEDIEEIEIPTGALFCKYAGTEYDCCKNKVCFENSPCKVRDYRDKYNL